MREDSSGTEYEQDNKDKGVSDSVLSLEFEFSMDEGCTERNGGDEGRCTSAGGEGPSEGQCRGRGGPSKCMERHLTLALIRCWVPRWKIFRIGGRRVPFSVFDIALLTDLLATWLIVELDGDEVKIDMIEMVRDRMAEWEREKMVTRLPGRSGKKRRFFRNYVSAMVALCEENNEEDRVRLWVRIYAFMIVSGVLFPW
ncbi:hypothetical protein Cgig2_033234 [Carnegiea gigantea]|uniref:Uncharacterized protein n=1 Tax=Carnegiea gigantea TaxID=171969 RepID=A0A9Q1GYQ9_9CARY|nr:hypothetical protein Cgig2_033234 [Carnegiea gigantea]